MSTEPKRAYDRESFIMIVDDDQTLLKFFKIHLNKFFSKVIVVNNAKEAIDTMKTKKIDLVLSDIRMPKIDGLQLLKKIRQQDASIPVYLISGGAIDDDTKVIIDEVSDGFLKKPFTVDEIQNFINEGMRKRELLKELSGLVGDNKSLAKIIRSKTKIAGIKDKQKLQRAQEIIGKLAS